MLTLNLLPPDIRRQHAQAAMYAHWLRALRILTIGCLLVNAGLFGASSLLGFRITSAEHDRTQRAQTVSHSDVGTIRQRASSLDTSLQLLSHVIPNRQAWSTDIATLVRSLPSGVIVTDLEWTADQAITLRGIAKLRSDFVALDTALKQNPNLTNVQTASQASRRDTLPFEYTATWTTP